MRSTFRFFTFFFRSSSRRSFISLRIYVYIYLFILIKCRHRRAVLLFISMVYIHIYIHTYIYTYKHTYTHTHIHIYIHTYIHICIKLDISRTIFLLSFTPLSRYNKKNTNRKTLSRPLYFVAVKVC